MKKLQLILTNPCSENWDEMPAAKAGRYCDNCAKHIIDLTAKTDKELIDFFKNKKANVCGRLLSTQLNRDLVMPAQKANWYWLLPMALGASMLWPAKSMAFNPVLLQNTNQPNTPLKSQPNSTVVNLEVIKGNVIDVKTGKPLVGVKVKWKDLNNVIAITDSVGNFSFSMAEEYKNNMLVFEKAGYNNIQLAITSDMAVKMSEVTIIRIGGVTSIHSNNKPLYVVYAGNKRCIADDQQIADINPDWIEKLEVLKDVSATAIYGSKGANGVILIGIKEAYKKKINFSKKN